ncbi:MAG: diaminopimelate epimerase, partial [Planctomycetota bacterium]
AAHARPLPGPVKADRFKVARAAYAAAGNTFLVRSDATPRDARDGPAVDGVIDLGPSSSAEARATFRNADGSAAETSGNGLRCVAAFLYESGRVTGEDLMIETPAGVRRARIEVDGGRVVSATVSMGVPSVAASDRELTVAKARTKVRPVSVGNPHAVLFWRDLPGEKRLIEDGRVIATHPGFPEGANVQFVRVVAWDRVRAVVYERGVGPTASCGSGACAVVAAGVITGRLDRRVTVSYPGGDLLVEWPADDAEMLLTGPVDPPVTT